MGTYCCLVIWLPNYIPIGIMFLCIVNTCTSGEDHDDSFFGQKTPKRYRMHAICMHIRLRSITTGHFGVIINFLLVDSKRSGETRFVSKNKKRND